MIWRSKNDVRYLPKVQEKWERFLCLRPRKVDGCHVWLEYVERRCRLHRDYNDNTWWWKKEDVFRLTEAQKKRLGEEW